MNKNKYNIEEVFKSELEDFEIDLPQNLWSNISNNLTPSATAGKVGLIGSKLFALASIATVSAIIGAVVLYSVSFNTKTESDATPTIERSKENQQSTPLIKQEDPFVSSELQEIVETTKVNPVLETVTNEHKTNEKQFSNNNTSKDAKGTPTSITKIEKESQSNSTEKPSENVTSPEKPSSNIEILELKPTEIVATIAASPVGGHAPLTVAFSHNNENVSTNWDFKDGEKSKEKEVRHTFEKQGEYEVELTITSEFGKTTKSTKTITVLSTSKIESIPNIFTPNDDNINDFFIVKHENIAQFNLYIYTQKGALIFETNDIEKGWNGDTKNEEKAESGDYIFLLKAKGIDGKIFEEKGIIKLAR